MAFTGTKSNFFRSIKVLLNAINQQKSNDRRCQIRKQNLECFKTTLVAISSCKLGQQLKTYMASVSNCNTKQMGMSNSDPGISSSMQQLGQNIGATQNQLPQLY